jgi:hypothetical protein
MSEFENFLLITQGCNNIVKDRNNVNYLLDNNNKVSILINTCHGGYTLSDEAVEFYKKLTGKTIDENVIRGRDIAYRFDPFMIATVRELGSKAYEQYSEISIRKVDFDAVLSNAVSISEYDGREGIKINKERILLQKILDCLDTSNNVKDEHKGVFQNLMIQAKYDLSKKYNL